MLKQRVSYLENLMAPHQKVWLTCLQEEYKYITSEEYVVDAILANEYTFTKDGKRFG